MKQNPEFSVLIHEILQKITVLLGRLEFKPEDLSTLLDKAQLIYADLSVFGDYINNNPQTMTEWYLAYYQEAQHLLQTQMQHWSGVSELAPVADRRFCAQEWAQHPFFLLISQHYLLLEKHTLQLLKQVDGQDPHRIKRIQFLLQQYCQALSPENFLLTNPQLLTDTVKNNGLNLLRGLRNFLADLQSGNGQQWTMPLADQNAFAVGKTLALTPGKVVYRNELIELIQYSPQTPTVHAIPLLMIPPWINKYYILDLSPSNSLAAWLVAQGIVVYMISWRNPDQSHAHWGLEDYLNLGLITAIETIQQQMQIPKVSTLGFCIGGTLLSILLAYYKAQGVDAVASATFLASLMDFSEPGELGVYMHEAQIEALEKRMNQIGYLEGEVMASAFNSLRPGDLIWRIFVQRYLYGQPPGSFDLLFWNMDTTNMPAKMHSEYLRGMYLNNDLVKPGKIVINQTPLDISKIDVPSFFLSTQKDHIAPWQSTYRGFNLLSGTKKFVLGGSGHIAGIVIPPGKDKYGYYTHADYPEHGDEWMRAAQYTAGSWWPEWFAWLHDHSGPPMDSSPWNTAVTTHAIDDAPGTYVHTKSR